MVHALYCPLTIRMNAYVLDFLYGHLTSHYRHRCFELDADKFTSTFSMTTCCSSEVSFELNITMLSYIICYHFGVHLPTG